MKLDKNNYYQYFLDFVERYKDSKFEGIPKNDPILKKLHSKMLEHNQHFHIGDMVNLKILFASDTFEQGLGIKPNEYDPAAELNLTHPDDRERYIGGRSKLIKLGAEIIHNSGDFAILSTNIRFRHAKAYYTNFLVQCFIFSVANPQPTVYGIIIKTNIDWVGEIKYGFSFYQGKDLSYFRVPDKDLISSCCIFTQRELEILKLIRNGLESQEIGEKLFISPHTVDTHRRNILKKTGFHNTTELIFDLQKKGFF